MRERWILSLIAVLLFTWAIGCDVSDYRQCRKTQSRQYCLGDGPYLERFREQLPP